MLNKKRILFFLFLIILFLLSLISVFLIYLTKSKLRQKVELEHRTDKIGSEKTEVKSENNFEFHGPRFGAKDVPNEYGFWSFAYVDGEKFSRSGQPNYNDFIFLKTKGYKTVVNLRFPDEYGEITDDLNIPKVKETGLNFVEMPIHDGGIPTNRQADEFIDIINNPLNFPLHIHCRAGIGRTGVMTALYRYEINHWPMEKAIEESRLFEGGVDDFQEKWLLRWDTNKILIKNP
jgi:protein tyrosine phosphatase (PTP) superfamily phosphohydrolase (DUF442 family)